MQRDLKAYPGKKKERGGRDGLNGKADTEGKLLGREKREVAPYIKLYGD